MSVRLRYYHHFQEDKMNTTISERYHRQVILPKFGEKGQQKLLWSKVLVIGAGGLGYPALQYLAAAGIGHIGIVDDDIVSLSDLHRQILYTVNDIGLSKAVKAAAILQDRNPEIKVVAYPERLTSKNALAIINDYEIVIDATDNFASRYMINDACVLLDRPLIYGAVSQYEGQVAVFNYRKSETDEKVNYRDLFPQPPGENEILNCAGAGVLGVLTGIIGTMQANEVIKLVTGIGEPLINRLLTYNGLNNQIYELNLRARPGTHLLIPVSKEDFKTTDYISLCRGQWQNEIDHAFFDKLLISGNINIIDVREMNESPAIEEFPNYRIPFDNLQENLSAIQADTVVTICQSGKRSLQAAKQLAAIFGTSKSVYSLRGGLLEWKKQHAKQSV